jgi:large subunit ribosomal protein L1
LDKKQVLEAVKLAREFSTKRNFSQTFDVIINLKDINLKKPEHNIDIFAVLPNAKSKPIKLCALVDRDLTEKSKVFDRVIAKPDFVKYQKPKDVKKLADEYSLFIAQGNIMADIAKTFGKVLGARGKMPNPKAECIITPASDLNLLKDRLHRIVRLRTKNEPIIKAPVGLEDMPDEKIAENILFLYGSLTHVLPLEEANIKNLQVKLTMGTPVRVGDRKEDVEARLREKEEARKRKKLASQSQAQKPKPIKLKRKETGEKQEKKEEKKKPAEKNKEGKIKENEQSAE